MGELIEPTYEDLAERKAAASRVAYNDHRRGSWAHEHHCAPEPFTMESTIFGEIASKWTATNPGFKVGFGPTEDVAVSDYYARNNTTDKYPKRGQEGRYH